MKKEKELTLDCPVAYTLFVLGGKWKWLIIYILSEYGVLRYGELKKRLAGITHKMLSQQLKELEAEKLLTRKEYHQIPPKVEYELTPQGHTLLPILERMCEWGKCNQPQRQEQCQTSSVAK